MKKQAFQNYIIPFYLIVVLLLIIPYQIEYIPIIVIPVGLLICGIYLDTFIISFTGLCFYLFLTLQLIPPVTFDDSLGLITMIFALLVPGFIALDQMLQHHDISKVFLKAKVNRFNLLISLLLFFLILIVLYFIGFFAGQDSFFSIIPYDGRKGIRSFVLPVLFPRSSF